MVHVLIIDTDKNIVSVGSGYKGTPEEVFLKVADDLDKMADAENLMFSKMPKELMIEVRD